MKTSDFNFLLPDELIARYPLEVRSESRLLHVKDDLIEHYGFSQLTDLLQPRDILIFNNTRVIPARLFASKLTGGKVEILIERILTPFSASVHVKSNKTLRLPCEVILVDGTKALITKRCKELFELVVEKKSIDVLLIEIGEIPLPGYMRRTAERLDVERYQTVFAEKDGAVAAPTAGLHFDQKIFKELDEKNIAYQFLTLHVGAGTFKPVMTEEIMAHRMHHEIFEINQNVCDLVNATKKAGGRVIAVGTTAVRALETAYSNGTLQPTKGETNIFIYPGYGFKCVDALITNFHLPRSTLLMLVCALGGYDNVMQVYQAAIKERYRFYSYGDAMLIEKHSGGCAIEI